MIVSVMLFWRPLRTLVSLAAGRGHEYDQHTHTLLIPFISLALMFLARKGIFRAVRNELGRGAILLVAGEGLNLFVQYTRAGLGIENSLSLQILALVLFWMGGFLGCYGRQAFRVSLFPLLFLLCMVPLPTALLNMPVSAVRNGSSDVTYAIFNLFGDPVYRDGFRFALSGVSIEVAKECSGVHSILALFIVSLLAGHLFLSSAWKRIALVVLVLPIVCLTNGVRIGILTLLAIHVDPSFLTGDLHRNGGIGFFGLAVGLLMGLVLLLQKGALRERPLVTSPAEPTDAASTVPSR